MMDRLLTTSSRIRGRRFAAVTAAMLLAGTLGLRAAPAGAASPNVVTTCDEPTLLAGLSGGSSVTFSCSGTITVTSPIVISSG